MPALPPCPQAAASAGLLPGPGNPWNAALEIPLGPPREDLPPEPVPMPPSADPVMRWPYHMPRWNAVDVLWWSCLFRAAYSPTETFVRRAAEWAQPVARWRYVPVGNSSVVGHALLELDDCWLCISPGTSSESQRLDYLMRHGLEVLTTNPVEGWQMNSAWYARGETIYDDILSWVPPATKPLITVGHSSGGPEAAYVAVRHLDLHPTSFASATTFGSPRWALPSLRAHITNRKQPQVVEFSTVGDPVALVPPPWSIVDAARLQLPLFSRPEYGRVGPMLDLNTEIGITPRLSDTNSDFFTALQLALRRSISISVHLAPAYTAAALSLARAFCVEQRATGLIDDLEQLIKDMEAAGI